jgi:hypothetical protein
VGTVNLFAAAAETTANPPIPGWLQFLGLLLGSGVVSAVVTALVTSRRATSEARRQGYASAIEAVLAWGEYAYRIRRRTSDEPAMLSELAALGHELQERRVRTLAWVAGESPAMYDVFVHNLRHLDTRVGPLVAEAWTMPPITRANEMVLSGWGPGRATQETVQRLSCAVSHCSGWRRWVLRLGPRMLRARLRRFLPPPPLPATPPPQPTVPGVAPPGRLVGVPSP